MSEKIAFVSWGYLHLVCDTHKSELEIVMKGKRTVYTCATDGCDLALPTELYEKLLDDVVTMQNKNSFTIGYRWKRRMKNEAFEFCVVSTSQGKLPTISVKQMARGCKL